jgi:hypothetical protein
MEPAKPNQTYKTWYLFLPLFYMVSVTILVLVLMAVGFFRAGTDDWVAILLSSFLFILVSVSGFLIILILTIYLLVKNHVFFLAIQRHWPVLLAIVYFFIPNFPGPIDEIIVSGILSALATYFGIRDRKKES